MKRSFYIKNEIQLPNVFLKLNGLYIAKIPRFV